MKRGIRFAVTILFLQLFAATAWTQSQLPFVIDLAAGSKTISSGTPGILIVIIKNRLPAVQYYVEVQVENIPVVAFSTEMVSPVKAKPGTTIGAESIRVSDEVKCKDVLDQIIVRIMNAQEESELLTLKNEILRQLEGKCKGLDSLVKAYEASSESLTTYIPFAPITVRTGQKLSVVVTRGKGDKQLKWTGNYNAGERGSWRVSYGFSFPYLANNDEDYFAKKSGDSAYAITKKTSSQHFKFIPSVFVHWLPKDDELETWSYSLAGGLGFDLKNPVVFLGGSLTYNQNLSLIVGGVAQQVNALSGRYKANDLVADNLGSEQLLEQRWVLNPFFTIAFRFESNPFK